MLDWLLGKQKAGPAAQPGKAPVRPQPRAASPRPDLAPQTYQHEDLTFQLRVNPRAKRLMVRLSMQGEVVVTAPSARLLPQAIRFAIGRADWIRTRLNHRPEGRLFSPGQTLQVQSRALQLTAHAGRGAAHLSEDGGSLLVGGDAAGFSRRVERWLRAEALRVLTRQSHDLTQKLGLKAPQVKIGDAKGRWGSCAPHTWTLRYNWRLILTPPEVLHYLVAHEVAHLIHPNHSDAFWALVAQLGGDVRRGRAWLKRHGADLHAWGQADG